MKSKCNTVYLKNLTQLLTQSINIVATTIAKRTNNFLSSNVLAKSSDTLIIILVPISIGNKLSMDQLICLLSIRQHWFILKYREDCLY